MLKNLMELLNKLHKEERHQEIIDRIESLSVEEITNEIIGILARAYNNVDNYKKAIELLKSIENTEKKYSCMELSYSLLIFLYR